MFKDELQHVKTAHHTSPEDDYEGDIREGTEFHRSREFAKPVTVYSVRCICMPDTTEVRYLDPPRLFKGDTENCHFRGTIQTLDAEDYIEEYPEVAFVVERSYKCNKEEVRRVLAKEARAGSRGRVLKQDQYLEEPGESGILLSAAAQGGLEAILEAFPCQFPGFQNPPDYLSSEDVISMDNRFEELSKPYSLFYLHGRTLIGALEKVDMSDLMRESVRSLYQASPELMGIEEPPEDFLYCLPSAIHGFDFTTKTWTTLQVDRVTDVTWNKRAFSQLVAPPETKELIQAVVSAHGERKNMGLDIIEGKGQGLLVLLHGGPGTGKTLTAESIAEEQERPLYRVTCGDIGTEPKDVERYLDVLEIGRAWGCVVLLDEADVFLEERSFSDQKRNAIISIFLRILEYYDGILILTTNRIGSFDEAFKSRIQLALGYPPLNEEDRLKIWSNFIQMLPRTKDRVDMEDLQMNLPKLALVEINGREIRNIITMARHLAKFRGQMLRYKHMRDAVESAQKFSKYLSNVKGVSDDDWARADKLR
ncbi:hypothetical protein CDV31_000614 [Fusarium ambrosium]|uniref:AAA+ ATPase domain-containing protein n=1 Tax=Fusarium ambrosium TaxID=131363 RepID=A0A428V2D6_9HYPO|nr:hypothetical protein CDV31_000614 [Fusarium ambrosium]